MKGFLHRSLAGPKPTRDRTGAVAWVGKTPLRPLARPQDRSGSPTKGAKLTGGNLPDCRLSAVSPPTARLLQGAWKPPRSAAEPTDCRTLTALANH
ncbi:MAG: hypothetical protein ACHBN1_10545 [Heteroscytonema crispum UTEX LB 1556]